MFKTPYETEKERTVAFAQLQKKLAEGEWLNQIDFHQDDFLAPKVRAKHRKAGID